MIVPTGKEFNKNVMGQAWTSRTRRIGLAIGVMHELGHSLGFHTDFGGVDNFSVKAGSPLDYPWWDYVSVMNYDYFPQRYLDYSYGENGEYDQNDWGLIDVSHFQDSSEYMEGVGAGVVFS